MKNCGKVIMGISLCITLFAAITSNAPDVLANSSTASISAELKSRKIYVNVNEGNDLSDGSENKPFKTIQKACDIVNPGDVVLVSPGIYYESIKLTRKGTEQKPIVFRSLDSSLHGVTITGADRNIREKKTKWTLEDEALQLYSVPWESDPARVTWDDLDMQAYNHLQGLKDFLLYDMEPYYRPGPKHGFYFDKNSKKLYLQVAPDEKYGSADPGQHRICIPPSLYETVMDNGVEYPAWRGDGIGEGSYNFGIETDGPAYAVIDGFTFETPGITGVYVRSGNVTVRNSHFRGCRSAVTGAAKHIDDVVVAHDVIVESCDYTQFPVYTEIQETIEDHYTEAKVRKNTFWWWMRKGKNASGDYLILPVYKDYETGGFVSKMGKNFILRNNNLYECFDIMPWHAFSAYVTTDENKKTQEHGGGNIEIYNNRFSRAGDNAIELENRAYNVKIHHNEFIDNYMDISWQNTNGKPWPTNIKFYKNIIYSSEEHGKMWLEKANYQDTWLKAGAEIAQWGWWPWMEDEAWNPIDKAPLAMEVPLDEGFFAFNNTIYTPYSFFLEKTTAHAKLVFGNFKFKNNIFVTHPKANDLAIFGSMKPGAVILDSIGFEFDHNMYAPSVDNLWYTPGGVTGKDGIDLQGPSQIGFKDPNNFNFELTENSSARGKGVEIPYEPDSSTDLGAIPYGTKYKPLEVGPRPFGDANLDNKVDAMDLAYINLKVGFAKNDKGYDNFCDLDFNGVIDKNDVDIITDEISRRVK